MTTTTATHKGKRAPVRHLFLTSIRTNPDALLRLIRQRWSIENKWYWARDAQLHEDAHRYADHTGVAVFSFLRTIVMNLLRRGGYRSIRQGFREPAYEVPQRRLIRRRATAATSAIQSWARRCSAGDRWGD